MSKRKAFRVLKILNLNEENSERLKLTVRISAMESYYIHITQNILQLHLDVCTVINNYNNNNNNDNHSYTTVQIQQCVA